MTTRFNPEDSRINGVKVADVRLQPMGALPGIRARLVLVDSESNPYSFVVNTHFSPKTLRIVDALYASLEEDYVAIVTRPEGEDRGVEFPGEAEEPASWEGMAGGDEPEDEEPLLGG
jgi:hypothetical protein